MNFIIYKPDTKSFLEEIPDATRSSYPIYRMSFSKTDSKGQWMFYIQLTAYNPRKELMCWIAEAGTCWDEDQEEKSAIIDEADLIEKELDKLLKGYEVREGVISEEVMYGALPEIANDKKQPNDEN